MEVSVALNFVISYLYNKLPRRRVDMFGEELERGLKRKFDGHWYGEQPFKGSAYRCIRVSAERVEPVIELAASLSRIDIEEVCEYLPRDLTIWIDPGEVSYRIGEKGVVKVLYSARQTNDGLHLVDREIAAASRGFNPDAQCFKPIDSLSSSLSNLSVSPATTSPTNGTTSAAMNGNGGMGTSCGGATSPWATGSVSPIANGNHYGSSSPSSAGSVGSSTGMPNAGASAPGQTHGQGPPGPPQPIASFLNRNQNSTMTTAMFAQTKFGSTKLKTQAKRPSRLSPTELGAYIKQRSSPQASLLGSPSAGPPVGGLVSPFGPPGSTSGRQQHSASLSPRGGSANVGGRGGPMLPPYGVEANRSLPPFYLLAQQGAPPPPPPTTSGAHLQGPPTTLPPPPTSLQDLYAPVLPSHFAQPPPATHYSSLNMPPFHDIFPTATSSSSSAPSSASSMSSVSSSTSGAGLSANTPSPDGGLSHKTFLEGLNYGNLPNYPSLQHLLVAN